MAQEARRFPNSPGHDIKTGSRPERPASMIPTAFLFVCLSRSAWRVAAAGDDYYPACGRTAN
jgi:hypothetical protein